MEHAEATWRGRVLLVDDDQALLGPMQRMMADDGFDVAVATCAADGLILALDGEFGVVVCDDRLPDMSGLELAQELQRRRPRLASRILLMSGAPPLGAALSADPERWLLKPFDLAALYRAIARVVATSPAAR